MAQTLLNGSDTYASVADGTDGFLFTTGGTGPAIQDAVKLAGVGTGAAVKYIYIAHGAQDETVGRGQYERGLR